MAENDKPGAETQAGGAQEESLAIRKQRERDVLGSADEEEEEESAAAGGPGDSDDAKRERMRRRRERQRADYRELKQLVADQAKTIGQLEQLTRGVAHRTFENEATNVDAELLRAQSLLDQAKVRRKEALAKGDADAMDALDEQIYTARRSIEQLQAAKEKYAEAKARGGPPRREDDGGGNGHTEPRQQQDVRAHPQTRRHATTWLEANPWYDEAGAESDDEDTQIAAGIDAALLRQGYDPREKSYWKELDKRIAKRLPHLAEYSRSSDEDEEDDGDRGGRRKPRQMVSGRGSEGSGERRGNQALSRVRREALREAGYTEGTPEWDRMVKRYATYDKEQSH
jgi:hypothetical protein